MAIAILSRPLILLMTCQASGGVPNSELTDQAAVHQITTQFTTLSCVHLAIATQLMHRRSLNTSGLVISWTRFDCDKISHNHKPAHTNLDVFQRPNATCSKPGHNAEPSELSHRSQQALEHEFLGNPASADV